MALKPIVSALRNIAAPAAVGLGAASQSEDADAGVITKGGKRIIEAFHGSPHKFDKFSMQNIGTGEGAQAYGHGLYFADSKDVARGYRDALSSKDVTLTKGGYSDTVSELRARINQRLSDVEANLPADYSPEYDKAISDVMYERRLLDNLDALDVSNTEKEWQLKKQLTEGRFKGAGDLYEVEEGSLYRVHLDVDPDTLLDWDKPYSQQPPSVQEALRPIYESFTKIQPQADPTGATLWRLAEGGRLLQDGDAFEVGGAAAASKLREAGIPGIRYADGMSRGKDGNQTFNYVMFDDAPISIQERGMATPEMLAATASAATAGSAAVNEYRARSNHRQSRYDSLRQSLLSGAEQVIANITNAFQPAEVFNSLEMPQRGLLGLGQGAVSMAQGQPIQSALREAARVAEQPVDQTAYDVGGYVTDQTGSPVMGTAANVATQMLSPF